MICHHDNALKVVMLSEAELSYVSTKTYHEQGQKYIIVYHEQKTS